MVIQEVRIGLEVVRSGFGENTGRRGIVIEIDPVKKRARVAWQREVRTWVAVSSLEPVSIPYDIRIEKRQRWGKHRGQIFEIPRYIKL